MSLRYNVINIILKSPRTVFNTQSLMMLAGAKDSIGLTKSLNYYSKQGAIKNPRKGLYTKLQYDEKEMACAIFRPSYISLEYVLQRAGVIFQWDEAITCVSYLNRNTFIDGKKYSFRRINPVLWAEMKGVSQEDNIAFATPERAFLDMVYLSNGNCFFDNLRPLSLAKINELLPSYRSKVLIQRVKNLMKLN